MESDDLIYREIKISIQSSISETGVLKRVGYKSIDKILDLYDGYPTFELRDNYSGKVTGTYIHPLLVNYV